MKPAFSILIISFLLFSCKSNPKSEEKAYKEEKESLYSKEKKNPLKFLKVKGDFHKNLFGQTVIKATVENKATVCTYKNIRIKMLFYDKNNNLFENHEELITENISPGNSNHFKSRFSAQKKTDSVSFSIMNAIAVEKE
ncbi:MAG: hypothetical protein JWN76_887 [Chitinophagaceae bacterium]|nr:hypothetical protein [Chitinophagaceae bacterium]